MMARVRFRGTPGRRAEVLQKALGVPVELGAPVDELVVPAEMLDAELESGNPAMRDFFEGCARQLLSSLSPSSQIPVRLRSWVAAHLGEKDLNVHQAASALGMSARTLQRRFRDDGRSMREVVDEVRRDEALSYLEEALSIDEISQRLGFSEPSAFRRAFKRWAGSKPGEYVDAVRGGTKSPRPEYE